MTGRDFTARHRESRYVIGMKVLSMLDSPPPRGLGRLAAKGLLENVEGLAVSAISDCVDAQLIVMP